ELRARGAWLTGVGECKAAYLVVLLAGELLGVAVAGVAGAGCGRVAALEHVEPTLVGGDPVAVGVVVVALLGQGQERVDGARRLLPVERGGHVTEVGLDRHPDRTVGNGRGRGLLDLLCRMLAAVEVLARSAVRGGRCSSAGVLGALGVRRALVAAAGGDER